MTLYHVGIASILLHGRDDPMGNRTTNALVFASILCCFVGRSGRTEERIESEARPNILILYGDDQSYKTLSCYPEAPKWVKTPNLEKLAASGIRFERAYLGAWCMPSRASLLTGRFQHAISSMSMEGTYPGSRYDPDRSPFFPKLFRQQGYETAQIGKWHTGTDTGYGRDWDYQAVWNRPANPDNAGNYYYDQKLTINGKDEMVSEYSTDHYTKLATEYIAGKHRSGQKPWMLWVCYGAIHGPTTPAQRHLGSLRGNESSIPTDVLGPWPDKPKYLEKTSAWVKGPDGKPAMRKRKTGEGNFDLNESGKSLDAWVQQLNECNRAIDESVGAILHTLQQTGQLEKTLVIYTADQGYAMGEHGFNQKVAPYDACIASPLIISRPAQIPSNQVCKHPVTAPDLMEFCCHTAGVTIPWKTHGRDIRPLIDNPKAESWTQPLLMTHTARSYGEETVTIPTDDRLTAASNVPWYALLRDGKYKYVRTLVEGETEEVYDLQTDPEELVNLAKKPENRSLLETLRSKAIEQLRRTDAPFVDHLPPTQDEIERAGQAKAIPKENETFLVGTAKVDITPEGPIRMNGFLVRKEESNSVRHPIWAKAMAIGTEAQDPCLLITVDTLGIPASVHREVSKRLLERYGLRTERIAITASHTHTGPMINDCAPNIFGEPIPEEALKKIDRYSKVFVDRLVEVAVKAMETRKPSKLQWGKGKATFAKNRRDKNGPIDHELPMLLVRDLQGALRAIYASYACHCVTLGDRAIGGDWAVLRRFNWSVAFQTQSP